MDFKVSYKKFDGYDGYKYAKGFSVCSNMNMLTNIILTSAWSPIVWKDNVRLTNNFIESSFLVLDFDEWNEQTLEDVNRSLADHRRIIATTKSHQISKNGVVCDRYRLIIPFTETIRRYADYRHQYAEALKQFPWADKSCLDGARYFFPCKEIVYLDRDADYSWELKPLPPPTPIADTSTPRTDKPRRRIPAWCLRFINDGLVLNGSRNMTLLGVCCELLEVGFTEAETRRHVLDAKIDWKGVNVEAILKSAKKKVGVK